MGDEVPKETPKQGVTWPDVAMAFIRELPPMGIIALVAILALKGQIKEENALIGFALSMLARSKPPEGKTGALAGAAGLLLAKVGFHRHA